MTSKEKLFVADMSFYDVAFHLWTHRIDFPIEKSIRTYAHVHFYHEVHYIYNGSMQIRDIDNGKTIDVSAGQFCLVPSNIYHETSSPTHMRRAVFFFSAKHNPNISQPSSANYSRINHILSYQKNIRVYSDPVISSAMENYHSLCNMQDASLNISKGLALLSAVFRAFDLEQTNPSLSINSNETDSNTLLSHNRRQLIEQTIESSYNQPNCFEQICQVLSLSERQTLNIVRELYGTDLKTLIIRHRINTADALIKTTNMPLSQIAYEVGYNSYSGFYMAYMRIMGAKPEETRRNYHNEETDCP